MRPRSTASPLCGGLKKPFAQPGSNGTFVLSVLPKRLAKIHAAISTAGTRIDSASNATTSKPQKRAMRN